MRNVSKIAFAALLGLGSLALTAGTASAAIVCNGGGYCWHTHHHYHYRHAWGITVHPDNWRWGPDEHYAWHEHAGRGYWRDGVWVTF
jgi:hypothetical protein